jgi:hypothetical protein
MSDRRYAFRKGTDPVLKFFRVVRPKRSINAGSIYHAARATAPGKPLEKRCSACRPPRTVSAICERPFREQITSPPVLTLVRVRKAAELTALAEAARAAALTGGLQGLDIFGLIRIENAAARAVRVLGLKVEPPPRAPLGLLRARERWAQAEKAKKKAREATATNMGPPNAVQEVAK